MSSWESLISVVLLLVSLKFLDQLGAKLVFTYRKERSRKELENY